ncbi:hypothetical protein WSS15_16750 [Acetobacter pasteurianus]|uniref:PilT/PilU family type 4a pilus ATPase n=1 Tax=Acetobacter pasteurianus TaxID=438 RepID=UPI0022C2A9E8|nr:PilT/PilU family type 4a pilus ATPase [Acetobacter pasteurianus]GLH29025.1 hypothetical protein WSS15_16750 [Acetobacter pasteurianus]
MSDIEDDESLQIAKAIEAEKTKNLFSKGASIGFFPDFPPLLIGEDIDTVLDWCIQNQVKDTTIETGKQIWVLVGGRREAITHRRLDADEVAGILNYLYNADNAAGMVAGGDPIDFGYNVKIGKDKKKKINLRVNATGGRFSKTGGVALQITLRSTSDKPIPLDYLNVPPDIPRYFRAAQGLNIIAGPTGSGKSVLMSSLIDWRCRQKGAYEKVIEYAEPIETSYPDNEYPDSEVFQSEVGKHITIKGKINPDPALMWAAATANAVRRGPSIIVVGEARGYVTMDAMLRAAQTGHLVTSTVHTIGVAETISRIVMEFPIESRRTAALDLLAALNLVVCQLLVPRIGGGVVAVREYMLFDDRIKSILLASDYADWASIIREVLKSGRAIGQTMAQDASKLMSEGLITWDVCESVSARTSTDTPIERLARAPNILERIEEREKKPSADSSSDSLDMIRFLKRLQDDKADDLILNVGIPAKLKGAKGTFNISSSHLTDKAMDTMAGSMLLASHLSSFIKTKEFNRSLELPGIGRFRVNMFVQLDHTGMAIRRISTEMPTCEQLHLPEILRQIALMRRGIFLVTGETGSGKSTTLAAQINWRNRHAEGEHIICVENPVEYVHKPINCIITQREVGRDTESFEAAIVAALRQNPDCLQIGEIRTLEVMRQALIGSDTGHPVFGTLHANAADVAINRIIALFPYQEREMVLLTLSLNLKGIMTQRLLKRADGEGRVLASEMLLNKGKVTELIRKGKIHKIREVMRHSDEMWTLEQSMADLVKAGLVNLEDALAESDWPEELMSLVSPPATDKTNTHIPLEISDDNTHADQNGDEDELGEPVI